MSEAQLLTKVRGLAATLGWMAYHTHDSRRSDPGFPDLVLVRGPHVMFRELKTAKGRVTPEQAAWLLALTDAGEWAGLWRPSHLFDGSIRNEMSGPRDPATNARLEVLARARERKAVALRRQ